MTEIPKIGCVQHDCDECKKRLEQPEQAPVYVQLRHQDEEGYYSEWGGLLDPKHRFDKWAFGVEMRCLYTRPQPAALVELTDEDIAKASNGNVEGKHMLPYSFARAIDALLREKNT